MSAAHGHGATARTVPRHRTARAGYGTGSTAVDLSTPSINKEGGASMVSGVVKWFNPTKGYGFIAPESGGKDIFVHISAVQKAGLRSLNEGQRLGFEVEQQQNGRSAAVNLAKME